MIDDKKIEEACDRALKRSAFNDNVHAYTYVSGFYDCAKWMQNKLLKDLWHSASKEPAKDKPFLTQWKDKWRVDVNSSKFPDNNWSTHCKIQGIKRWLYVDDLLPKTQKGGNHD